MSQSEPPQEGKTTGPPRPGSYHAAPDEVPGPVVRYRATKKEDADAIDRSPAELEGRMGSGPKEIVRGVRGVRRTTNWSGKENTTNIATGPKVEEFDGPMSFSTSAARSEPEPGVESTSENDEWFPPARRTPQSRSRSRSRPNHESLKPAMTTQLSHFRPNDPITLPAEDLDTTSRKRVTFGDKMPVAIPPSPWPQAPAQPRPPLLPQIPLPPSPSLPPPPAAPQPPAPPIDPVLGKSIPNPRISLTNSTDSGYSSAHTASSRSLPSLERDKTSIFDPGSAEIVTTHDDAGPEAFENSHAPLPDAADERDPHDHPHGIEIASSRRRLLSRWNRPTVPDLGRAVYGHEQWDRYPDSRPSIRRRDTLGEGEVYAPPSEVYSYGSMGRESEIELESSEDGNVTIKLSGGVVFKVGDNEIKCEDGGRLTIRNTGKTANTRSSSWLERIPERRPPIYNYHYPQGRSPFEPGREDPWQHTTRLTDRPELSRSPSSPIWQPDWANPTGRVGQGQELIAHRRGGDHRKLDPAPVRGGAPDRFNIHRVTRVAERENYQEETRYAGTDKSSLEQRKKRENIERLKAEAPGLWPVRKDVSDTVVNDLPKPSHSPKFRPHGSYGVHPQPEYLPLVDGSRDVYYSRHARTSFETGKIPGTSLFAGWDPTPHRCGDNSTLHPPHVVPETTQPSLAPSKRRPLVVSGRAVVSSRTFWEDGPDHTRSRNEHRLDHSTAVDEFRPSKQPIVSPFIKRPPNVDRNSVTSASGSEEEPDYLKIGEVERAVRLLCSHGELKDIFEVAGSLVSEKAFESNVERLLFQYGKNLKSEALNALQSEAAKIVIASAPRIVDQIWVALHPDNDHRKGEAKDTTNCSKPEKTAHREVEDVQSETEDEDEGSPMHKVKGFMMTSRAYQEFRDGIRTWLKISKDSNVLRPPQSSLPTLLTPVSEKTERGVVDSNSSSNDSAKLDLAKSVRGGLDMDRKDLKLKKVTEESELMKGRQKDEGDERTPVCDDDGSACSISPDSDIDKRRGRKRHVGSVPPSCASGSRYRSVSAQPESEKAMSQWTEKCNKTKTEMGQNGMTMDATHPNHFYFSRIQYWIRRIDGAAMDPMRKRPREGHVRVNWNCRCGKRLSIEVPESDIDAATQFAQQAAGSSHSRTVSATRSDGGTVSSSSTSVRSSPSRFDSADSTTLSTAPSTAPSEGNGFQLPNHPPGTKRYLLLCANSSMTRTRMRNVDLTNVGHDEVLFHRVREAYQEMRYLRYRNPFVIPKTMQYVKFELIVRQRSGECVGNLESGSIPPIKEVYSGRYSYQPCPPDIGKYPMHPDVFMHSFLEPGDHTGRLAVERLPKKMHRELDCNGDLTSLPVGWGIHITEGFNWQLIQRVIIIAIVATAALVLGWSIRSGDVQGGTGIGSFCVAVVALLSAVLVGH